MKFQLSRMPEKSDMQDMFQRPNRGYLYLPMEIAVRELDSRLLIASMAVERGMEVILGQKWLMEKNIETMPPGLWIFKTMTKRDAKRMARCKAAGHMIASIDEEIPATAEGSGELLWVSDDAVKLCDKIFCLGEEHKKSLVGKWPEIADKLLLIGNPRWDFLRPGLASLYESKAKEYRNRFGRIILINTNSGSVNPEKKKADEVFRDYVRAKKIDPNDQKHMQLWTDFIAFEEANFAATVPLSRRLAKEFPNHTILLRPHPGEKLSTYSEQLSDLENVKVLFEGAAAPWIIASDVLIHTGCTTGIEAFALGKPSVNFETEPSRLHAVLLSSRLSLTAHSEDEVLCHVRKLVEGEMSGPVYPPSMTETFRRFFHAQQGPLAAQNAVESILTLLNIERPLVQEGVSAQWRPKWNYKSWWPTKHYNRKMFPRLDLVRIGERLAEISRALGHENCPSFSICGDSVLHLHSSTLKKRPAIESLAARTARHMIAKVLGVKD